MQYRDIKNALSELGIQRGDPTIVHASSSLIPLVRGGSPTIVGAILACIDNILMPSFTYKTMIIPEVGPSDNLLEYGSGRIENLNAAIFSADLPADHKDYEISETFRHYPDVVRSQHPILSFIGLGLDTALASQTISDPYGHIQYLQGKGAKVLLMGKEPDALFCLHYCERICERRQYIRWALTQDGIQECPHFPGCSDGFHKITFHLGDQAKQTQVQNDSWFAFPLDALLQAAIQLIREDAYALLCNDLHCAKCNLIRKDIRQKD